MKGPLDNLVGHVRTVIVAGVEMIHAGCDRLLQNCHRTVHISRRSPDLRTGQLHRAVAHAIQSHRTASKRIVAAQGRLCRHFCSSPWIALAHQSRSNPEWLKRLADELFAFPPERLGVVWIKRVSAHSFADGADRCIVRHKLAHMAVLAISAANLVSRSNHTGPHRSCGSLRNRLPLERCLTLCRQLLVHLVNHRLQVAPVHMAAQLGLYAPWMHSRGSYAARPMPLVERYGKKDIRSLRSAICDEGLIRRPFKAGILEINIGEAVSRRREVNQTPSFADKGRNPVHQHKVAQVIRAELRLETIEGLCKRCGHYARIRDYHVQRFALCEQFLGASTHAFKTRQIEFNHLEAPATRRCVLTHS